MVIADIKFTLDTPIKLVNMSRNLTVVSFPNGLQGRANFSSDYKHLEIVMQKIGLLLPKEEIHNYSLTQNRIFPSDKNFGVAFYSFYYQKKMNPEQFQWQPLKSGYTS